MSTEVWRLRLTVKGALVEVTAHDFLLISNIYDALMKLEREEDAAEPSS